MERATAQVSIDKFIAWFTSHGGYLHPALHVIYEDANGLTVRRIATQEVLQSLPEHEPVIKCPHTLSLSSLNAIEIWSQHGTPVKMLPGLPQEGNSRLLGAVFLCVQYLLGKSSFWHPYIDLLPKPVDQPARRGTGLVDTALYWSENELSWLEGTNLEPGVRDLHASWTTLWSQWENRLEDWTLSMGLPALDWDLFKWALTIFGSRSFSPFVIRKLRHPKISKPLLECHNPHSLLYPGIDLLNHNPRTANRWIGTTDTFNVMLNEDLPPGSQLWNTYGCSSNAQLLLSYGFCLEDNPYDAYALRLLSDAHSSLLGAIDDAHTPRAGSHHKDDVPEAAGMTSLGNITQPSNTGAVKSLPPAATHQEFTACDLANNIFMVRDPGTVQDDDEYPPAHEPDLAHLRGFPEMLLARLAAQVSNGRERKQVSESPGKFSSTLLYRQLGSRNFLQLGELLREKLTLTLQALRQHDGAHPDMSKLSDLSKTRFQQAQLYRNGQVRILEVNVRLLQQHIGGAVNQAASRYQPQLLNLAALLKTFNAKGPNIFEDFMAGFGELSDDIDACAETMHEQESEDVFTVATIVALRSFAPQIEKSLGNLTDILGWYSSDQSTSREETNDLVADVRQYATSMREAFPASRLWSHNAWDDLGLLRACANFVMEEMVTLAPLATGPQMLCVGTQQFRDVRGE